MATISKDIILIWTGSHATIPSGWSRETTLDDKYPKAWGAVVPDQTGGNSTHSHTSPAHSHTMSSHSHLVSTNGVLNQFGDGNAGGTELVNGYHSHNNVPVAGVSGGGLSSVTSTYASFSNDPPYHKVIFIKATTPQIFPDNGVCLYSGATVPTNYNLCDGANSTPDLRDKYLKGASTGADAGTTGGTLTNVHGLTHTHTESSHSHSQFVVGYDSVGGIRGPGDGADRIAYPTKHTYTLPANSAGSISGSVSLTPSEVVEPAYKKLIAIQKTTSAILVTGIIGLWLGATSALPRGWVVCDGTNDTQDMRDKFLKIGTGTTQIGNTGGSNAHAHGGTNHSHSGGSHTHATGSQTSDHTADNPQRTEGGSSNVSQDRSAKHTITSVSSIGVTWANAATTADSSDNQPAYLTVAYVQLNKIITGASPLLNFM